MGCFSIGSVSSVHAVSDLKVRISIDKDDVERGDTQRITVTGLPNSFLTGQGIIQMASG